MTPPYGGVYNSIIQTTIPLSSGKDFLAVSLLDVWAMDVRFLSKAGIMDGVEVKL